jgi:Fic family protein
VVLNNLQLPDDDIVPGKIREHSVTVGRYLGPPAEECEYLLEKLCSMLQEETFSLGENWDIASGVLKAILAHIYIAWIHPFGEGNGRTARLVEFKICISSGVPAPAAHLLSNHYNETRTNYYIALDRAGKSGNPFVFIDYALQGFVDQLDEQINRIRKTQHEVFWRNYIHTAFQKEKDSPTTTRRRRLMLDISKKVLSKNEWVPVSEITMVSPRVAKDYGSLTQRALNRDLNVLIKLGLLLKQKGAVGPNSEILRAYLPKSVTS